jgi:hypothetical protein
MLTIFLFFVFFPTPSCGQVPAVMSPSSGFLVVEDPHVTSLL